MSKAQAEVIAELRLEVEAHRKNIRDARDTISRLKAERRTIAERQREACAASTSAFTALKGSLRQGWTDDEMESAVRATPLVTGET